MKENLKSLLIGLAALAALAAWLHFQPKPPADWSQKGVGESLFPDFKDPLDAHALTIVRPKTGGDDESGGNGEKVGNPIPEAAAIRVVRGKDGWVLQTASDAPADNAERLTMIFAPLLRLTVLSDVPEIDGKTDAAAVAEFHRSCRLLDPAECDASEMEDAGIRLTVAGSEGEKFVDLIIGAVPEASSSVRDIRYVRWPGENRVFTADFSGEAVETAGEEKAPPYVDRLSTDPLDWMNRDLLRISRWNIALMTLFDYGVGADGKMIPRRFITLAQDSERPLGRVWERIRQIDFDQDGKSNEWEISDENRFPDNDPFNAAADAVGRLTFLDLARKPDGLADLIAQNRPTREWIPLAETFKPLGFSLADHDPIDPTGVDPRLVGRGGEISLTMTDGTELTLLFGEADGQKRRPLWVIPSFSDAFFPKPEVRPIPDGADDEEKKRLADENSLRESEYALNKAEGEKNARLLGRRFDRWFYFIDDADYRKIFSE